MKISKIRKNQENLKVRTRIQSEKSKILFNCDMGQEAPWRNSTIKILEFIIYCSSYVLVNYDNVCHSHFVVQIKFFLLTFRLFE